MHNKIIWLSLFMVVAGTCAPITAQVVMDSSTEYWAAIQYPNNNLPDPFDDQQTGSYEADIVGDANHAALYTAFDDGGTAEKIDGWIAFRFRMAGEKPPAGYTGAAFVGIDANLDGALDIFIGVNNSGSADEVGVWYAGDSANTSPGTTSVDAGDPYWAADTAPSNYDWSALSETIDPDSLTLDVNVDGNTDYFLSFSVPLSAMIGALDAINILNKTADSPMTYISATATQANKLNQDLGGVEGGIDSEELWTVLGGTSNVTSPNQTVPEPATLSFLITAFASTYLLRSALHHYRKI